MAVKPQRTGCNTSVVNGQMYENWQGTTSSTTDLFTGLETSSIPLNHRVSLLLHLGLR